ncbi:MAG TPA: choice-of-anchor tandem repeat GloVer-containing protein [Rhizomicrobium sp.]|nr:choice-of-anchor tandem repeat GloVer-containing protein [Rhizomicrobium sp.]
MRYSRVLLAALALAGCRISGLNAATLTNVLQFNNYDGATAEDGPIEVNGQLFGTTLFGGTDSSGVIFQLDPATGAETVLYSFKGGKDGWQPQAGLVYRGGQFFGTTVQGGNPPNCLNHVGCGIVFRFDLKKGKESVLYRFSGGTDGATPTGGNLVYLNGKLYGTTFAGGASGMGVVYAVDAKTGNETVLHSFSGGTDGEDPQAGLIYANGTLYGLTDYGGNDGCNGDGCGTAFAIDPASGAETILHVFGGTSDGAYPLANLVYHDGTIYGTTNQGGSADVGTIFSMDATTGAENVLFSFDGNDGALGDGVIYHDGHLFGSTASGGTDYGRGYTYGTVFDFDLATNEEKVLYSFSNDGNGGLPGGRLLYMNGDLWGTTSQAGAECSCGTVFKVRP